MQLTNRLKGNRWAFVIIPAMLLLLWDFSGRLYIGSGTSSGQDALPKLPEALSLVVSKQTQDDILALYASYDLPELIASKAEEAIEEPKPSIQGLSEEEQLAQNGLLDSFFTGDNKVHLSGIFWDQQYFAVLVQTNVKSDEVTELRLKLEQQLGHYVISDISKNRVEFTREDKTITLRMF